MNDISKTRTHDTNQSARWVCGVALAAMLVCGLAVSSEDNGVPSTKFASKNAVGPTQPVTLDEKDIPVRPLIFHSEDMRHIPDEIMEKAWNMKPGELATPRRNRDGVFLLNIHTEKTGRLTPLRSQATGN